MKKLNQELVLKAVQGDKKAVNAVVENYYQKILYTTIQKFGVDRGSEVAHKAVVEIIQSLKNLKEPEKLGAWIMRLVHYVCIDEMRLKYRGQEMLTEFDDGDPDIYIETDNMEFIPEEYVINVEKREQVLKALDTLPQNYQDALVDFFFHEMTYEEISEVKDISINKVRNDLFRGKTLLKKRLEAMEGKEFTYSFGVGALPILSQLLKADAAAKLTPSICTGFLSGVQKGVSRLSGSGGSAGATTTVAKIVATSVMTVGLVGGVFMAVNKPKEVIPDVPVAIEATVPTSEATTEEIPLVINTLEDMIGIEEVGQLAGFENGTVDKSKWIEFLEHIGAELEEVASEHESKYTVYLLRKQNKQLMVAEKSNGGNGNIEIYHQFGDIEDIPMMIEIILQFDAG